MSPTWTPSALESESHKAAGLIWRVVEHQHTHSTRKLVDTQEEQQLLESILEETKPAYPPSVVHLDYLLKTPFRYLPPNRYGSRFRTAGSREGVFYGAVELRTALAETAFYRIRFFSQSESPLLPRPREQLTAFTIRYKTSHQLDLTKAPLDQDANLWTSMESYKDTQKLASTSRTANIETIRYQSVRDAEKGANLALLSPASFDCVAPLDRQTWYLYMSPVEVNFLRAHANCAQDELTFKRSFFEKMPAIRI